MAVKLFQTNFTAGVLDKQVAAREDMAVYYNGLQDGLNVYGIPLGGLRRRPGKEFVRWLSPVLEAISYSGATVTAPNGGTAANVHDGDILTKLTTNTITGTPFVIVQVDFAVAVAVDAVDIVRYSLAAGAMTDRFFVQSSPDASNWTIFGPAFNWDASERSRRIRHGVPVSARYWRVVKIGSGGSVTASIGELQFFRQTATLSDARMIPFAYSTDAAYMMVCTDQNIDVIDGLALVGAAKIPHVSSQLRVLNWAQTLDTLILFHRAVQPQRVFRQGADDEWDFRERLFRNIPKHEYGALTGGVDEVQMLNDGGTVSDNDKFTILLEGKRTTTIVAASTRSATATAIETALRALSNTSATGITVVDDGNSTGFQVTFGGDDGKRPWLEMSVSPLSGNSVWDVSRLTEGRYTGEDVMSDTRGWPRCGAFAKQRLHLGSPGLPNAWVASVIGDYFNLDTELDDPSKGIFKVADADQISTIYQIVAGRNLTFFANDAEMYVPSEVIDADSEMKVTTRRGIKEGVRVYEVDGAQVFIQGVKDESSGREIGTSLREFLFVDTEQSYDAGLLSKFCGSLIKDPVDMALRRSVSAEEADVLLMVNSDGTGTAFTRMRSESVAAALPFATRPGDRLLTLGADHKRRIYFVTERQINGQTVRYIEKWNDRLFLDCGRIVTVTAEEVTAGTDGQDAFVWTFDNPGDVEAIGVRVNGGRLPPELYTADLGTKTVTLAAEVAEAIVEGDIVRIARMIDEVNDAHHLEGETVQTFVDGSPAADAVVSGGVLALEDWADTEVQYGFDYEVYGALMPLRVPEGETLLGEKVRVIAATMKLQNTGALQIRANDRQWQDVPLRRMDSEVLDRSMMETLFTGEVRIGGLTGYAVGAPLEFRQPGPGPLTLLGIAREVRL